MHIDIDITKELEKKIVAKVEIFFMMQSLLMHTDTSENGNSFKDNLDKDALKFADDILDLFDALDDVTITNLKSVS